MFVLSMNFSLLRALTLCWVIAGKYECDAVREMTLLLQQHNDVIYI